MIYIINNILKIMNDDDKHTKQKKRTTNFKMLSIIYL
jgi:hypothetical protein